MLQRRLGDAPGGLGELSGTSREPPGTARAPPESDRFGFGSDFGDALGGCIENGRFSGGVGIDFRRFWVDSLLASVLVSVALESLWGKSNTLEFDDPYEGFATFWYLQRNVTAKRTCRKTCEFRL